MRFYVGTQQECEILLEQINDYLGYSRTDRSHTFIAPTNDGRFYMPIYVAVCEDLGIENTITSEEVEALITTEEQDAYL